jgi:DNA-directed RNA polymerase specialized sigma subunit
MAQLPELQKKVLAMYYHENMQLFKIAAFVSFAVPLLR